MTIHFDPESPDTLARKDANRALGGTRPYVPYRYSTEASMAVKVALATGRPLLLRGEAGSGKSTLAYDAAVTLGWTYYEKVFTSRTTATEAMWSVDAVHRLADAQMADGRAAHLRNYVVPDVLWWAFDPRSAASVADPGRPTSDAPPEAGAVVLLDEIDKADPDVPNDLLQPLGDNRFVVRDLGLLVERQRPLLLIVTSNQERALTRAFLRRCVCLTFPAPDRPWLRAVVGQHFPDADGALVDRLLDLLMKHREAAPDGSHRPGVSELLDAIRACHAFGIRDDQDPRWQALGRVLMKKHEGDQ